MSNRYQVRAAQLLGSGSKGVRARGALLGGGIPLIVAALALWASAGYAALLCWGAMVGAVVGGRFAPDAVTSRSPVRLALKAALVASLWGAVGTVAAYAAVIAFTGGLFWLPYVVAVGLIVGPVLGLFMSVPVALLSVFVLRRTARWSPVATDGASGSTA